jgi:hypothetical protein
MRRTLSLFLFALPIGLPALAQAGAPAWPVSAGVRGGRLEVSWDRCPVESREWEAFLSLDGGRDFPIRVTPHLSASIRSFSWPIPRLISENAKLRIRFGDGKTEREYDVEGNLALQPAPGSSPLSPALRDLGRQPVSGEEKTTAWVEGSGPSQRTVSPSDPPGARPSSQWRGASRGEAILPARRPAPLRPRTIAGPGQPSLERAAVPTSPTDTPSLSRLSRLNV